MCADARAEEGRRRTEREGREKMGETGQKEGTPEGGRKESANQMMVPKREEACV